MVASTGNDPAKEQPPAIPANLLGDFAAGGALGVVGILAALMEVQRGGRGQVVDLGMA
jgi:alpha-methylacyl-CoA racemase